jgi:prevent-host-death family protein
MPDVTPVLRGWKLQDAKARFSELVRAARAEGPQRVTVHGRDAVVVLSAEDYARLAEASAPREPRGSLLEVMQASPLRDLHFDFPSVRVRVRKPVF